MNKSPKNKWEEKKAAISLIVLMMTKAEWKKIQEKNSWSNDYLEIF